MSNIDVLIRREEPDEFHCLCLIKAHREFKQVLNHPPPPLCGLEWLSVQCREGSVLYEGWASADSCVVCLQSMWTSGEKT